MESLKALIEAEMRVPAAQQAILKDGAPLRPGRYSKPPSTSTFLPTNPTHLHPHDTQG